MFNIFPFFLSGLNTDSSVAASFGVIDRLKLLGNPLLPPEIFLAMNLWHFKQQRANNVTPQPVCNATVNQPGSSSAGCGRNWVHRCNNGTEESASSISVYDANGSSLQLGKQAELGAGGEGTVYSLAVSSKTPLLVKIFKPETLKDMNKMDGLSQRMDDMLNIGMCRSMNFLAWPVMPVCNAQKQLAGFVMRKVSGRTFRSFHYAASIPKFFPGWDRRDLVLVALDFVKKISLLASLRVLVNDFNPANFLVNENHSVNFIDCDSFQVPSTKGGDNITKTYFETIVAPELLKDKQLMLRSRTMRHLGFATGVTVFQLLMCGLYPYSHCGGGMPRENLLMGKCPLGVHSGATLPTGFYNLLSWMPYNLVGWFIKMFKDGHGNPEKRPSLDALVNELDNFLHVMKVDPSPERRALMPQKSKKIANYVVGKATI